MEQSYLNNTVIILSGEWGSLPKEAEHTLAYSMAVNEILSGAEYSVRIMECNGRKDLCNSMSSMKENVVVFNTIFGRFGENGTIPTLRPGGPISDLVASVRDVSSCRGR